MHLRSSLLLVLLLACSSKSDEEGTRECACPLDASAGMDAGANGDAGDAASCEVPGPRLARVWTSTQIDGCLLASALQYESASGTRVIAASGDGHVRALRPDTGAVVWDVTLPVRADELAYVVATPVIIGDGRLVVAWQDVVVDGNDPAAAPRTSQRVAVVDLETGTLDAAYPTLSLAAQKPDADGTGTVTFNANNALSRSRLLHVSGTAGTRGLVYVSLGNARDIQPWHGWVFELDLDAWHDDGVTQAIRSTLLTTPESQCGNTGHSGSREMVCGGGVWAPAGPELVDTPDGRFDLFIPTGNGALDLPRHDYAHTLMRVHGPGLSFADGCDPTSCADWDVLSPSSACMNSCTDLFIPRLLADDPPFDVPACEGLSFFECYAALDWDLGANSPAVLDVPEGPRVLLLPAKDGGVYLIDYDHLGVLHDRLQIVEACGSDGASCGADWAGMMVTRPEITLVDGVPLAVIATFNWDDKHPAGLVGVRIVMREGKPQLEKAWEAPAFAMRDAVRAFRRHPSRVRLFDYDGVRYATVVDQRGPDGVGELYLVRVSDGAIERKVALAAPGQRFSQPLWLEDKVLVTTCNDGNRGPSRIEAWQLSRACPLDAFDE